MAEHNPFECLLHKKERAVTRRTRPMPPKKQRRLKRHDLLYRKIKCKNYNLCLSTAARESFCFSCYNCGLYSESECHLSESDIKGFKSLLNKVFDSQ